MHACAGWYIQEMRVPLGQNAHIAEMTAKLRLRDLEFLQAIDARKSISAAATDFGMTQPAASRWLMEIEKIMRAHLFLRSGRLGLAPTEAGTAALAAARAVLAEMDNLSNTLQAVKSGAGGSLRLGVIHMISARLLSRLLSELAGATYRMSVTLIEGNSAWLLEALQDEKLDVAILRSTSELRTPQFTQEVLFQQSTCVLMNTCNPLVSIDDLDLTSLAGQRWILPPQGTPTRHVIDVSFSTAGLDPPRSVAETVSVKIIHDLLLSAADVVCVLPAELGPELEGMGGVRSRRLSLKLQMPPINVAYHTKHKERAQVRALTAVLRRLVLQAG